MSATLEDALLYAIEAHKGQRDKSNLPYILHPISVMLQMDTDEERILALCHDIAEDTLKSPHDVARDLGMNSEWTCRILIISSRSNSIQRLQR
jgi:(p)ppGpp synthase/HD superfamily hydrolase